MRDCITRTVKIYTTPLSAVKIDNGIPKIRELETRISSSLPSEKKLRQSIKLEEGETLVIGETTKEEKQLKMSLDYFIANAEEIKED